MSYLRSYHAWTLTFMAFVLAASSACAPLQKTAPDAQIFALQEELRYVRNSNKAAENAVEDIYGQLRVLDSRVDRMKNTVEESIPGVQQDLEKVRTWSVSTQETVEDIYVRLRVLESKVDKLAISVEELASRPQSAPLSQKPEPTEGPGESESSLPELAEKPSTKEPAAPSELKEASISLDDVSLHEYEQAYGAYVERRYEEALALFNEFLKRYPDHELTDNAQYWLGETYYDMGDYPGAILTFKDVVTHFPDADKAPDALLKIGYAYLALDDPSNARMFLKRLIKKYPLSSAEAKAQAKLKEIEENP